MLFIILLLSLVSSSLSLPYLNVDGFSWAENLCFDGNGNLFVSDWRRGEFWRIWLNDDGSAYEKEAVITGDFKHTGGMQVNKNGTIIYAGVTYNNDTKAIIYWHTNNTNDTSQYFTLCETNHQPNGLAYDYNKNIFYYTDEGMSKKDAPTGGTLTAYDVDSKKFTLIKDEMDEADGLWIDIENNRLYVGLLMKKNILVFDTTDNSLINTFEGLSSLSILNQIDDITLYTTTDTTNLTNTRIVAADWLHKDIKVFDLGGTNIESFNVDKSTGVHELYQPTSVRWGKGKGFDSNSIYVTEGGGMEDNGTTRRVVQIVMSGK